MLLSFLIKIYLSLAAAATLAFADPACAKGFKALEPPLPEGLRALQEETQRVAGTPQSSLHELAIKGGRGFVRIGILQQRDLAYAQALSAAVREGSIAEIDAGKVVGAKVLPMLSRVAASGPKGADILVHGSVSPRAIFETIELFKKEPKESAEYLSEGNIRSLQKAMEALGVREACLRLWKVSRLELCGPMKFRIDSKSAKVLWDPAE